MPKTLKLAGPSTSHDVDLASTDPLPGGVDQISVTLPSRPPLKPDEQVGLSVLASDIFEEASLTLGHNQTIGETAALLHETLSDPVPAVGALAILEQLTPAERSRVRQSYHETFGRDFSEEPSFRDKLYNQDERLIQRVLEGQEIEPAAKLELFERYAEWLGKWSGEFAAEGKAPDPSGTAPARAKFDDFLQSLRAHGYTEQFPSLEDGVRLEYTSAAQLAFSERRTELAGAQLDREIHNTKVRIQGMQGILRELDQEISAYEDSIKKYNPYSSNFWRTTEIQVKREEVTTARNQVEAFRENLEELLDLRRSFSIHTTEARHLQEQGEILERQFREGLLALAELQESGDPATLERHSAAILSLQERAQTAYNRAQEQRQNAQSVIPPDLTVMNERDAEGYLRLLSSANRQLQQHVENLDAWEEHIRTARTATVVLGASLATGGLLSGHLAVTSGIYLTGSTTSSVALGTMVGTTAGALSNTAEAAGHMVHGNSSPGEAIRSAIEQTQQDAKTSLISSLSAAAGTRAGGLARGSQEGVRSFVAAGAVTGGTNAGVNFALNTADQYRILAGEFEGHHATSGHSPEELERIWREQFVEPHGLTAEQILRRGAVQVGVGTLSGGLGAGSGIAQQSLKGTASRTAVEAGEVLSDIGLGVLETRLEGQDITFGTVLEQTHGTLTSSALGKYQAMRIAPSEGVVKLEIHSETAGDSPALSMYPNDARKQDTIDLHATTGGGVALGSLPEERLYDPSSRGQRQRIRLSSGSDGEVVVSNNGRAVFGTSPEAVRELYADVRYRELLSEAGPFADRWRIRAIAQREASAVRAFWDPATGQMVMHKPDNILDVSRDERVIYASYLRHEEEHHRGGGEFDAWRAQAAFLNRNELELRIRGDVVSIGRPAGGSPIPTPAGDIEAYAARYGRSTLLAAARNSTPQPEDWGQMLRDANGEFELRFGNGDGIGFVPVTGASAGLEVHISFSQDGNYSVWSPPNGPRAWILREEGWESVQGEVVAVPGEWISLGEPGQNLVQLPPPWVSPRTRDGIDLLSPRNLDELLQQSEDSIIIGRNPITTDLVIPDLLVSNRHLEIRRSEKGFVVEDLNSRNGTYYLDPDSQTWRPVQGVIELPGGTIIALGRPKPDGIFSLPRQGELGEHAQPSPRAGQNDDRSPKLSPRRPDEQGRMEIVADGNKDAWKATHGFQLTKIEELSDLDLEQPIRIGRAPDNHITLQRAGISRTHVEISQARDGSYRIRDLQSTNGTYLYDPVTQEFGPILDATRVPPGSIVSLGRGENAISFRLPATPLEHQAREQFGWEDAHAVLPGPRRGLALEMNGIRFEVSNDALPALLGHGLTKGEDVRTASGATVPLKLEEGVSAQSIAHLRTAAEQLQGDQLSMVPEIRVVKRIGEFQDSNGNVTAPIRALPISRDNVVVIEEQALYSSASSRRLLEKILNGARGQQDDLNVDDGSVLADSNFVQEIRVEPPPRQRPDGSLYPPMHVELKPEMFAFLPRGRQAYDVIKRAGIRPITGVQVGDARISFTNTFEMDEGRIGTIGIVEKNGRQEARVYYLSNSEAVYRLLPAVNSGPMQALLAGYDKAGGEYKLSPPSAIQEVLAHLGEYQEPVRAWDDLREHIVYNNDDVEAFKWYMESSDVNVDQHIRNELERRRADGRLVSEAQVGDVELLQPATEEPIFGSRGRRFRHPTDLQIASEMAPDFRQPVRRYELTTNLYGSIQAEVFHSKDGSLEYIVLRDAKDRAWFGHVGSAKGELNRFGTPYAPVNAGDLTMPLAEYWNQVPRGYGGPAWADPTSAYVSAWNYIRENPHIQEYYRVMGREIPPRE